MIKNRTARSIDLYLNFIVIEVFNSDARRVHAFGALQTAVLIAITSWHVYIDYCQLVYSLVVDDVRSEISTVGVNLASLASIDYCE